MNKKQAGLQLGYYRTISKPRNVISWGMFIGLFLIEIGIAYFIGAEHFYGLGFTDSFELMFGTLLLAHGLLKRGRPYKIGKVGTILGAVFLAFGVADYYGRISFVWAILFIIVGIIVLIIAATRAL